MKKRPNILFLMSDEHRPDVTGYEGNKVIRTPTLDRLAREGVVFRNAYTPSPICIPGRQCLASGQLPKTSGCESYGQDLEPGTMTFARRFSQYAYRTICAGKLHHMGADQMQGWTERIAGDLQVAPPFIEGLRAEEKARYPVPEGRGKWSNQQELAEARPGMGPCREFDQTVYEETRKKLTQHFFDPEYRKPKDHFPLLYKVSFKQPHYPYFTDEVRFRYYYDRAPVFRDEPGDHPVLRTSQLGDSFLAPEEDARRTTAAYYGMIDQVDEYYGGILAHLERLGQNLDDWIIVYTSDHGEMLGQHGIWEKTRFYEASVRVPLIIRWPKGFAGGRVVTENVNLCDLFATLCELAEIPVPPEASDSRSLVPLLKGEPTTWDNETISQVWGKHLMIKRDALKYQFYSEDGPEVLFDLEADPGETQNVIDDPQYTLKVAAFRQRKGELGF
ncbi:MAG: sulfatase-like hydrolase/transferase [Opitutales bacterium]|nr:sulfatase-like hydrolase/transferase [Opitutales bacterium]MCH8539187.1 sulfatase-like hydrolase/transferase [Opitutales bacterium]